MKKIIYLTFLLFAITIHSQTTSEYRIERNKLKKEATDIERSFGSGGEVRYFPELVEILKKNYNWRNLNSSELKIIISNIKKLKNEYLKPDGAYSKYLDEVKMLNIKYQEIHNLAQKINIYSSLSKLDPKKTQTHRYLFDNVDEKLIWLNEHLNYKLKKEGKKN